MLWTRDLTRHAIHRSVEQHAATLPDATAILEGNRALTYRALNARANLLARGLIARGLRHQDVVLVRMNRSRDLAVALLAILKAGAAYCWIDPVRSLNLPPGLCIVRRTSVQERYVWIDVHEALEQAVDRSSPNLPVLTRPSDVACVLADDATNPCVLVPHATLCSLKIEAAPATRWDSDPAAFSLWVGLASGGTVVVAAGSAQPVAA